MTKCFEPDSIDLIKPLAVDECDDDDDDDDDIDIIFPHNTFAISPYRPVQVTQTSLTNENERKLYVHISI
jgi:hypothetical protein